MDEELKARCTCCCMDCIEGRHCGGSENDHGICMVPVDEYQEDDTLWDDCPKDED